MAVPMGADAPILEVMRTMRAMRRLKPDPVPDELLDQLVDAATWAPSGGNLQGYHYVVVTDREVMASLASLWRGGATFSLDAIPTAPPQGMSDEKFERLRDALRFQRDNFADTPAVIVPCYGVRSARGQLRRVAGRLRAEGLGRGARMVRSAGRARDMSSAASVYPGVQNMLLTARALGLGATLTTWHLFMESEFKEVLGIPKHVQTYAIVPVGWPRGNFGPVVRQPAAERIHRDRW